MPSWFVQGYQEYLGLTLSSAHSRTITMGLYKQMLEQQPGNVDTDFGINVANPYYDGTMLMAFMHDTYGSKKVMSILTESGGTFGTRISTRLDPLNEFVAKFKVWRAGL
jgi:hypothetical protein